MDNYPLHLAPDFDEGGGVVTLFEDWWSSANPSFPNVPKEVARYWLHEHWNNSPYGWLPSLNYSFSLIDWPANRLELIRSRWCNFEEDNAECMSHGRHLITGHAFKAGYKTAIYMQKSGDFPTPIIILDNRDGHLVSKVLPVPPHEEIPMEYFLVEGHRRFNMALYLHSIGMFRSSPKVWLMTHQT